MIETFGSLEKVNKDKVEKFKNDYIKSIKLVPEYLEKLSISERKLIIARQERLQLELKASADVADSMTKVGKIEGPKLAGAFIDTRDLKLFPPLDSTRNLGSVLTFLGYAPVSMIKDILEKRYEHPPIKSVIKEEIIADVKKYHLNIPHTRQFIYDFVFQVKGNIYKLAGRPQPKKKQTEEPEQP